MADGFTEFRRGDGNVIQSHLRSQDVTLARFDCDKARDYSRNVNSFKFLGISSR